MVVVVINVVMARIVIAVVEVVTVGMVVDVLAVVEAVVVVCGQVVRWQDAR